MSDHALSWIRRWARQTGSRSVVPAVVAAVVVTLAALALWSRDERGEDAEAPRGEASIRAAPEVVIVDAETQRQIGVTIAPVRLERLVEHVRATGVVGPDETRIARIRPLARGVIQRVYVRSGDRVRPGDPLAAYDNIELGELMAEYRRALAELEKTRADADVAARALERARSLVELGALSTAEYDRRRAEEVAARAAVQSQQAILASLERRLQRFGMSAADLARHAPAEIGQVPALGSQALVRAPFGGVVIATQVAEGETVDPERELFTIASLSTVWVQGHVYEKDIASIVEGQDVTVSVDAYPGETFAGTLTSVSDTLDPNTRTARVRCEVANPGGRLKLEMFATVEIPTSRRREALVIPVAAVQRLDNRFVVFVKASDTEFRVREVRLGAESGGRVEVTAGLTAGERVVVEGALMLKSTLKVGELGEHEG